MKLATFKPRFLGFWFIGVRPFNQHSHAALAMIFEATSRQQLSAAQVAFLYSLFLSLVRQDVPPVV